MQPSVLQWRRKNSTVMPPLTGARLSSVRTLIRECPALPACWSAPGPSEPTAAASFAHGSASSAPWWQAPGRSAPPRRSSCRPPPERNSELRPQHPVLIQQGVAVQAVRKTNSPACSQLYPAAGISTCCLSGRLHHLRPVLVHVHIFVGQPEQLPHVAALMVRRTGHNPPA